MSEKRFSHVSVLPEECIAGLNIKPDGIYIDATLGGAGHTARIAQKLGERGRVIGIDRDRDALEAATERMKPFGDKFTAVKSNFSQLASLVKELNLPHVDGILFDLGVSSHQLDTAERGFSYMADAPLDMRMDTDSGETAAELLARIDRGELSRILSDYGEERFAPRIAAAICAARDVAPIDTTAQLRDIIVSAIPVAAAKAEKQHPAKRSFQAIRIAVNGELDAAAQGIEAAAEVLSTGGRLCVITFHSLEDRLTKQIMKRLSQGCTCPRDFPVCICGAKPILREITKKPIVASQQEQEANSRAHSAKLRIAEKF